MSESVRKLIETLETKTMKDIVKSYEFFKKTFREGAMGHQDSYEKARVMRIELENAKYASIETVTALLQNFLADQTRKEQALRKLWNESLIE